MNGKNTDTRKATAKERADECRELSIPQRIAKLDARLGKGVGAVRERKRLAEKLATLNTPVPKKEMPQDNMAQDKSPRKYARKYSGKEKAD